jgi:UDP-3-O-[3-hydroxymyristoyl] glucosamine N-acyltransferase
MKINYLLNELDLDKSNIDFDLLGICDIDIGGYDRVFKNHIFMVLNNQDLLEELNSSVENCLIISTPDCYIEEYNGNVIRYHECPRYCVYIANKKGLELNEFQCINHISLSAVIEDSAVVGKNDFAPFIYRNIAYIFPQIGGLVLGNNVYIGHNSVVCRGSLNNTILNEDVKIDSLCQVGHGTEIGERTFVAAGTIIAGHCKIGKNCLIGIGSKILQGIEIGDNCIIGAGSVVTTDIPDNKIAYGVPCKIIKDNKKINNCF